ncbi:MAG: hypothetical protein QM754_20505 [Tepidisphaeraceae bacterium]
MKYALGLILAAVIAPTHLPAHDGTTPAKAPVDAVTAIQPLEVRVRKLHIVRPDLQRFPIPYDTVC